jgi:hypothetical protein
MLIVSCCCYCSGLCLQIDDNAHAATSRTSAVSEKSQTCNGEANNKGETEVLMCLF